MKIALPVTFVKEVPVLCLVFARARQFMIFDVEKEQSVFLDNPAVSVSGGAGIVAAQTLIDAKVDAVIVPQCGENAMNVLFGAGIRLFQSVSLNVSENLKAFQANLLRPVEKTHPGFHSHP